MRPQLLDPPPDPPVPGRSFEVTPAPCDFQFENHIEIAYRAESLNIQFRTINERQPAAMECVIQYFIEPQNNCHRFLAA